MTTLTDIQRHVGVTPDGLWGPRTAKAIADALGMQPFDRSGFLANFVNTKAPALTRDDMNRAADRLGVTARHIDMLREVESGGKSFDDRGRPVILPEPHIFYRVTNGRFGLRPFSYPKWGTHPYPRSYDARWELLADMAECDERGAIESASWGLWQIMGFHWNTLGYESPMEFACSMVESEQGHLEALVRFLEVNKLQDELQACRAGSPDSCRAFARAYNGPAYAKNSYHVKMSEALR